MRQRDSMKRKRRWEGGTYRFEIIFVLKDAFARGTVMMRRRLPIMLMQPMVVLKNLIAGFTKVVNVVIMLEKLVVVGKVLVAVLAIVVSATLDPMLFEPAIGRKIDIAVVTDMMVGRFAEVLGVVANIAAAAVAVGHGGGKRSRCKMSHVERRVEISKRSPFVATLSFTFSQLSQWRDRLDHRFHCTPRFYSLLLHVFSYFFRLRGRGGR
jgi:hypothetical protein